MGNTRLKLGQYEAWAIVENQEVEHYAIEVNEETKVASCWIASTAGKHFGVYGSKSHTKFDCATGIKIDGSYGGGHVLPKDSLQPVLRENVMTGDGISRALLFGELNLTDDDTLLVHEPSHAEFGEIKMTIDRVSIVGEGRPSFFTEIPEIDKVHERCAKKAVTHKVSFGKEVRSNMTRTVTRTQKHETVATFIFRYRSLDILKANGIVPHDPTPAIVPSTSGSPNPSIPTIPTSGVKRQKASGVKEEKSEEEIDPDEEEYRKKEAELQAELEKVKRARFALSQDKRPKKKLKTETKPVFLPGEVIDLTI